MAEDELEKHLSNPNNLVDFTPRQHIRLRPAMYIGGKDSRGLHHLIWAVTDHMLEEAMLGLCRYIHIEISDNNEVLIRNDGTSLIDKGINVESNSKTLDALLTECKIRPPLSDMYYGVQGGLHGIGLCVVNCLSEKFSLTIEHHTNVWMHFYEEGLPTDRIIHQALRHSPRTQTTIRFKPDFEIMDKNDFDMTYIVNRFRDVSYLFPQLEIHITDYRDDGNRIRLCSDNGLSDWVSETGAIPLQKVITGKKISEMTDESGKPYTVVVQFAFQFTGRDEVIERSFINSVLTPDGGTHLDALHEAILHYALDASQKEVTWDDISSGFVGIIHLLHPNPEFEGRTRLKITNTDVKEVIFACFQDMIAENPDALSTLNDNLVMRE